MKIFSLVQLFFHPTLWELFVGNGEMEPNWSSSFLLTHAELNTWCGHGSTMDTGLIHDHTILKVLRLDCKSSAIFGKIKHMKKMNDSEIWWTRKINLYNASFLTCNLQPLLILLTRYSTKVSIVQVLPSLPQKSVRNARLSYLYTAIEKDIIGTFLSMENNQTFSNPLIKLQTYHSSIWQITITSNHYPTLRKKYKPSWNEIDPTSLWHIHIDASSRSRNF